MKGFFEEYGKMLLRLICAVIAISFLIKIVANGMLGRDIGVFSREVRSEWSYSENVSKEKEFYLIKEYESVDYRIGEEWDEREIYKAVKGCNKQGENVEVSAWNISYDEVEFDKEGVYPLLVKCVDVKGNEADVEMSLVIVR